LLAGAGDASGRAVGWAALVIFVLGVGLSIFSKATFDAADPADADVALEAFEFEFSEEDLSADAGEVTVAVTNDDPVLHTFTIDELDVHVDLPAQETAAVTFDAEPGEYRFYCAITGHEELMNGTIEIR
jgi:plastocyanin